MVLRRNCSMFDFTMIVGTIWITPIKMAIVAKIELIGFSLTKGEIFFPNFTT
jgi:hypothetical protein